MSTKVLQILNDRVLSMLKDGKVPWRKPWKGNSEPYNIAGYPYKGMNFFLLSMLGHEVPVYLTFNQIKSMGGRIKEGEEKKHFPVFFWKLLDVTKDKQGNDLNDPRKIPLMRFTQVWNISQVDGVILPKRFLNKKEPLPAHLAGQEIVDNYKNPPQMQHGGDRACYSPVSDLLKMPVRDSFDNIEEYYSTFFHEMTHSTGHTKRLNRKELMDIAWGNDHSYSQEELVAEMGAAFLCAKAGISNTLENSAAYIAHWVSKLQDEPKMLMVAASRAQKAFAHIVPDMEEIEGEE